MVPVFAEFRYGLTDKSYILYLFSKGGAMLNIDDTGKKNVFLNCGIGVMHPISDKLSLNLGVGLFTHNSGVDERDSFINLSFGLKYAWNRNALK